MKQRVTTKMGDTKLLVKIIKFQAVYIGNIFFAYKSWVGLHL